MTDFEPSRGTKSDHWLKSIQGCCQRDRTMATILKVSPKVSKFLTERLRPVAVSTLILVTVPEAFYTRESGTSPWESKSGVVQEVVIGWESLLHVSIWPIVVVVSTVAFFLAHKCDKQGCHYSNGRCVSDENSACCGSSTKGNPKTKNSDPNRSICSRWSLGTVGTYVLCMSLILSVLTTAQSQLQIIYPSWVWNPFMWGTYQVYKPDAIQGALGNLCVNYDPMKPEYEGVPPLCLHESSWKSLSSEALSSRNDEDVDAVLKGLTYAQQDNHGMIINIMSRDTVDAIDSLRQNVEGLVPFFSRLAVVVFENDSKDGSREAFKKWGREVEGKYTVDVMDCPEAENCVFGESHRYDSTEAKEYFKSSAIGRMAEFRQRIVDYVVGSHDYVDYSHMMVLDLDLMVSLSPLGVLHTLGKTPDDAVACSGRQSWPGSFGSLVPPYDFSAFRAVPTPRNERILDLHQRFCGLSPPGDRWRNQCDAVSPMHFMLVLGHDRASGTEPYPVESAFNGATIYPLTLVKETRAKYDVGDDGQRCEHIGFNLSLKRNMYINPKWNMHVNPAIPGGPTGDRAIKNIFRIIFTPRLSFPIFFQNVGCMILFVYSILILVMHLLYPFWVKIITGTKFREIAVPCVDRTRSTLEAAKGGEVNFLIGTRESSPRKRKISDFEKLVADAV